QADPRGEQFWRRVKAVGNDPRGGSQLGRLVLRGELTEGQEQAGKHIARIYANFERSHGRTRFALPAAYTRFIESTPEELAEQRVRSDFEEEDRQARQERLALKAERRMRKLQECIDLYGPRAREALETLCVDDKPLGAAAVEQVASILDHIG